MSGLYQGKGAMVRELILQLLREHGPKTNRELADLLREETRARPEDWPGVALFGWSVYPHMRSLENQGRVRRHQAGPKTTIMWEAVPEVKAAPIEVTEEDRAGIERLLAAIDADDGKHGAYEIKCFNQPEAVWIRDQLERRRPELKGKLRFTWMKFGARTNG